MKKSALIAALLAALALSETTHAADIQSMTIEEIGVASGGLGTSASGPLPTSGGEVTLTSGLTVLWGDFISAGSTDGAILMGSTQGNGAFTPEVVWTSLSPGQVNTLYGAPSGTIAGNAMSLNMSGFTGEELGLRLTISPDAGTMQTAVSMIDGQHYYYTADWSHLIGSTDVFDTVTNTYFTGWTGSLVTMHLEGIATVSAVPEPEDFALMLSGLGLLGIKLRRAKRS